MKYKDERAKLTNAILSDMKAIKLYGWEKAFMEKVLGVRGQELQALKRSQTLFAASLASFHSSTFLVSGSYIEPVLFLPFLFLFLSGQIVPVGQLRFLPQGLTGLAEPQWTKTDRPLRPDNVPQAH